MGNIISEFFGVQNCVLYIAEMIEITAIRKERGRAD